MTTVAQRARSRRAFTLVEALVALGIIVVLILISIPVVYRTLGSFKRKGCENNLHRIGEAMNSYQTTFNGTLPIGSKYQKNPESPWGGSWWLDLLPYADHKDIKQTWSNVASCGNFNMPSSPNPNIKKVDGLRVDFMFCPSSLLPPGSDPAKSISPDNQKMLGGPAQGIPVPSYVAISGSAPDMQNGPPAGNGPRGRNTKDGKYGILSASGMFPPNVPMKIVLARDGMGQVMAIGEQSIVWEDSSYDPPVPYDFRSNWPNGAFMGAGADYGQLSPSAEGVNGTGDQRCFNCTTIRYPINSLGLKAGMFAEPLAPIPPPKEGEPPRKVVKYPPGPGHNHGLFSAHSGGANVLYLDGAVHFKTDDTDVNVLYKLATRDDGQIAE